MKPVVTFRDYMMGREPIGGVAYLVDKDGETIRTSRIVVVRYDEKGHVAVIETENTIYRKEAS